MKDWLGLAGRTAVVTGASGGLGRAIASELAQAGMRIALLDYDERGAASVAAELAGTGADAIGIGCDVSAQASVTAAAGRVSATFGAPDLLVNNAAVLRPGALDTLALGDWNAMIAVNLTGYFLCAQTFGRAMLDAGKGAIVHVASIAAHHPQGGSGAYSVTKAGVAMLSRQLATEWGPRGIRSNVVCPGLVRTPMSEPFYTAPGVLEKRTAVVPMRRIGAPADIADAVVFLASDRASYISGEEITVDGGFTRMVMNLIPRPAHDA